VTTIERAAARAHRRADRVYRELADEFRAARLAAGVSQEHVARAAGISRPRYTKVEAAQVPTLSIHDASRIAAVLGLDLSVRSTLAAVPSATRRIDRSSPASWPM
jgi:transcriptional regulator with XRE-family HTH domain